MNRPLLFCMLTFLGVVGVTLAGGQKQAIGGHGCHGCHGAYTCSGCYGCHGCDGCFGGHRYSCHGCHGCWGQSVARRRVLWSSCHGGCHGCSGCYGCDGCSGCYGCHGCRGDAVEIPSEPAAPPAAPPAEPQARLNVEVPADAVVIINDHVTTSTGSDRSYVTRGLKDGGSYRYEVRVEMSRDGETLVATKVVELGANSDVDLTFDLNPPQVASIDRG